MDTQATASGIRTEIRYGARWAHNTDRLVSEMPKEKASEYHLGKKGYEVMISLTGKPAYVLTVNTNTKVWAVSVLDDSCQVVAYFDFRELKTSQLFLRSAWRHKVLKDDDGRKEIGITTKFLFLPGGEVNLEKSVSRDLAKRALETLTGATKVDPNGFWLTTPPFGEFDPLLRRDFVDLDAIEAQCPPESWVRQGPPPKGPTPYDKAAYYLDDVRALGLSDEYAENHTLLYLRWLIENKLMSSDYLEETAEVLSEWRVGKATIRDVYRFWGSALMDDMLSSEANAFTSVYYAAERRGFIGDCSAVFEGKLASPYHLEYSEANYQQIKPVLDRRFQEWKRGERK
jgi:hypothetical protein